VTDTDATLTTIVNVYIVRFQVLTDAIKRQLAFGMLDLVAWYSLAECIEVFTAPLSEMLMANLLVLSAGKLRFYCEVINVNIMFVGLEEILLIREMSDKS
jgi:hypothetical protein